MKQLGIEHQVPEDHDVQDGQHRGQALVVAGAGGAGAEVEVWRLTQIELGEISPAQLNAWVAEGKAWSADPSRVHAWVQQVSGRAAAGDGEGGDPPPA